MIAPVAKNIQFYSKAGILFRRKKIARPSKICLTMIVRGHIYGLGQYSPGQTQFMKTINVYHPSDSSELFINIVIIYIFGHGRYPTIAQLAERETVEAKQLSLGHWFESGWSETFLLPPSFCFFKKLILKPLMLWIEILFWIPARHS